MTAKPYRIGYNIYVLVDDAVNNLLLFCSLYGNDAHPSLFTISLRCSPVECIVEIMETGAIDATQV